MDFDVLRWTTIHPAVVHLPIGIFALAAIAYVVAAVKKSERWSFAADVMGIAGAISLVIAAAFGLVSWFVVDWPGGISMWPTLHMVLGLVGTGVGLLFMGGRIWARRRSPLVGAPSAAVAVLILVAVGFVGWIGGEVLVFHNGIAVAGAGHGALAPAMASDDDRPESIEDAMGSMRGAWATATVTTAEMVVQEPTSERFETVAQAAGRLQQLSRWVADHAGEHAHPGEEAEAKAGSEEDETHGHGDEGEAHGHGEEGKGAGGEGAAAHDGASAKQQMRGMSIALAAMAGQLQQAARQQDLPEVSRQVGEIGAQCGSCHQEHRWNHDQSHDH